jgi:tetratricopeptide (TPR) repeat protein
MMQRMTQREKITIVVRRAGGSLQDALRPLVCWTAILCFGVGPAVAQKIDADKLPMYGQPGVERPENLKKADETFVRDATLKFGTRAAASRAMAAQGWAAMRNRNLDLAIERFNQSWLLNSKNYQAFWGFGAVLSERGKVAEAIEQLGTARELIDDSAQITALLSDVGAVNSEYAAHLPAGKQLERAHHFVVANQAFAESLDRDPNYAASWREWAISLYQQQRYSEALVKAQRAKELKAEPFPLQFLEDLQKKLSVQK